MSLVVQKFGGSSLATPEKIHRAARRAIRSKLEGRRVVLVVSAMGDSTDELLKLASGVCSDPPKRELDMLLTTGEQVSIALMAMAIESAGHEAISLTAGQLGLVTDSAHTRARIQRISRERIDRELDQGRIVIVAGFQGTDAGGEITTMGRGASDTTAVALAGALGADRCEVYKDVDGVYTADPRLVPNARRIPVLSYDAMLEMAGAGAGVLHPRAIDFARKFNVALEVRSSLWEGKGTMITPETAETAALPVRGVVLREDLALAALAGVPNQPGVTARVFAQLADKQILVDDIVQGVEADGRTVRISFSISRTDAGATREVCERLRQQCGWAGVEMDESVSKISAIGVGMRSHAGVAHVMFDALARAQIDVLGISTSEIVISCLVRRGDGPRALRGVHDAFGLGEPGPQAPMSGVTSLQGPAATKL
ncbi:MAG TPA: aspartate kinase [Phycisphaerae bacterium]|nr:aspartate kinase [Phycisphaerae bacterium]HNU44224.1 aspartate kinase [Phycisphaerae bacterium]